jgi:hypothetical protein
MTIGWMRLGEYRPHVVFLAVTDGMYVIAGREKRTMEDRRGTKDAAGPGSEMGVYPIPSRIPRLSNPHLSGLSSVELDDARSRPE